jgi:hypothetical protein
MITVVAGGIFKVIPEGIANQIIVGCFALFNPHPGV